MVKIFLAPFDTPKKKTLRLTIKNFLTYWETKKKKQKINNMFVNKKPLNLIQHKRKKLTNQLINNLLSLIRKLINKPKEFANKKFLKLLKPSKVKRR